MEGVRREEYDEGGVGDSATGGVDDGGGCCFGGCLFEVFTSHSGAKSVDELLWLIVYMGLSSTRPSHEVHRANSSVPETKSSRALSASNQKRRKNIRTHRVFQCLNATFWSETF
jgi:hypothetical protein